MVWEFLTLVFILGLIAALLVPWMRRGRTPSDAVEGTLLITGVSPRPDATGEQFVTVTGVINGPTVDEHVVYQLFAVNGDEGPTMGDLVPVVYSPRNPDLWRSAPPPQPEKETPF